MSETASTRYVDCSPPPTSTPLGPCGTAGTSGSGTGGTGPSGGGTGGQMASPIAWKNFGGGGGGAGTSLSGANGSTGTCPPPCSSKSPIRYANGGVLLPQADILVPEGGFFSHVRFYSNQSSAPYSGPVGFNWWIGAMPTIVASGSAVCVTFDPNNSFWFDQSGSDYVPRYGVVGIALVEDTATHTLTFTQSVQGLLEVTVFNDLSVWPNPGGLISHTDSRGIVSTATIASDGMTSQLQRTFVIGGATITETLLYTYYLSGSAHGQLQTVTLQRAVGSASPVAVQQVTYAYYGASDANGNLNDLLSASQQLPDGSGGWNTVAVDYYRYYLGTESTGIPHGLKMHFGPEAYRLMFNNGIDLSTATDPDIQGYADHVFQYDPSSGRVTQEIAAVCPGCPGGGTTADLFAYTPTTSTTTPGYNVWAMKAVQTLPDSSTIIVYSNYAGMPMLKVIVDPGGSNKWCTAYIYNADGLLIWTAQPSAVNGYDDAYDDLLHYSSGLYAYLNTHSGLINVTNYYTTTGSGAVLDYVQNQNVRQGQSGGDVLLRSFTYSDNVDGDGNAVYLVATDVSYPSATDTSITITTSYAYTFNGTTNILASRTTTLPVISSGSGGQNGSGATYTFVEAFDAYGNTTQTTDERGIVNNYTLAGPILGAVTEQVLNYQSSVTAPGVNVTTDFTYDNLGRLTQTLGPTHTVVLSGTATAVRGASFYVYIQSVQPGTGTWAPDQTRAGQGYATGTSTYTYYLVNPVSLTNTDKDGRTLDQISAVRTSGSGALSPSDAFAQSSWQSWTNIQYDHQHRTTGQSVYFLIPSSGSGTVGTNYGQTTFGYDSLERRNRVEAPGGTITRTVWTTPQWVASVWVGTDDTGATDSNPAGSGSPNNMVMVRSNVYDFGSAGGDGNLTQQTQYTGGGTRVTNFGYDFRDRQISTTDATNRYFLNTYDNLSRIWQSQGYSSVAGTLFAQKQTKFDDRGRPYRTFTFAVNPSTGAVGNALIGNKWYDPSGNLLQEIAEGAGKVFTKRTYNGVGWIISSYLGYNTSGTSWIQAGTVSGDIVVEQRDVTFDEAGNPISAAMSQRLNDAPTGGSGSTGALSYGTSPKARVSYMAAWFDGIDRNIAGANYGAIASFTRPTTPPASSATILVNLTAYNNGGEAYQTTDPMGFVNQSTFDDAGRTTQVVEAYGTIAARTTQFLYTLDSLISQMIAKNPITGDQVTTWDYGTTLTSSGVARNDLLASVAYPDSVSGSDVVAYAYNRLGEQRTIMDQRSTIRSLYRDLLGRLTNDCVTTVGSDTDGAVLQIMRGFDIRGMVNLITSTDSATQGAGTILNQVTLGFNDFSQLIVDQQSHSGAVTMGTPGVQYAFDSGASSSNEIRLNQLKYPNSRTIGFSSGTSGGMSDYLNRVDAIVDTTSGSTTLAQYLYLGISTPIRITYPQPGIWLDLWGGTSGVFAGIDRFGRVIDQRWQNNIGSTPADVDRYEYGYDLNSNRQWKRNVVGDLSVSSGLDEFYTYDPLNRLTKMQRGVLNSSTAPTGITGTPSVEQDWTLDPVGNWSNFTTKASGTTNLDQTRSTNTVNEITNITATTGPEWIIPGYDKAGNTITMPQVADPTQKFNAVYDAWNRLVILGTGSGGGGSGGSGSGSSSSGSGSSSSSGPGGLVARYQYDGRNFRIVKDTYSGGTGSETRHFYYTAGWRNIEEQVGGSMVDQHVWGLRYIDELICRDDATPQRLYATQDANFNLTSICNSSSGTPVERYVFDPYGLRTVLDASWVVIGTSAYNWVIGHQGLMIDPESRLLYNRERPVNSPLGRFVVRDPVGYGDGMNLYLCCRCSPINWTDSLGLAANAATNPTTNPTTNPADPGLQSGVDGLAAALDALQSACDSACKGSRLLCTPEACKAEAAKITDALIATWKDHFGKGTFHTADSCGGYYCWDWAQLFTNAVRSIHPKCFKGVERKALSHRADQEVHYYLRLWACPNNCTQAERDKLQVNIDDGFFDGVTNVHVGPFPTAAQKPWEDVQWSAPTQDFQIAIGQQSISD